MRITHDGTPLFLSDYLCAEDLKGKDIKLTISRVTREQVFNPKTNQEETKPVLWFVEMEERHKKDKSKINKRMISNASNAHAIAQTHGYKTEGWVGVKITLCPAVVQTPEGKQPALRVTNDKGQIFDIRKGCWIKRTTS